LLLEEELLPIVPEVPIVLDPGRVLWLPEGMPGLREELLLGELSPISCDEEPIDDPLPVWPCTKVGIANAEMLTARTACHNLLFFIGLIPFYRASKARLL